MRSSVENTLPTRAHGRSGSSASKRWELGTVTVSYTHLRADAFDGLFNMVLGYGIQFLLPCIIAVSYTHLVFIQTERQIWLLAAALEIVLFHSDLIIVQRLY